MGIGWESVGSHALLNQESMYGVSLRAIPNQVISEVRKLGADSFGYESYGTGSVIFLLRWGRSYWGLQIAV